MKLAVLLALTTAAHADGYVGTARVGGGYVSPYDGGSDSAKPGAGLLAGIEGGYAFGRLRPSLSVDLARLNADSVDPLTRTHGNVLFLVESISAKLQVDVIGDLVFVWGAIGFAAENDDQWKVGLRYEGGLGVRYWVDHGDAIRLDASYAHASLSHDLPITAVGGTIGYEHWF